MPIRIVLLLSLIGLASDVQAHDGPASALQFENPPKLELAEILEQWKAGFTGCDRPGSQMFRRLVHDEVFRTETESHCTLAWDGSGNWQIVLKPVPISFWESALSGLRSAGPHLDTIYRRQLGRLEAWGLRSNELIVANMDADEFESFAIHGPANRDTPEAGWWNWTGLIVEIPRQLLGPGWPGTPGDWVDDWEWQVLAQGGTRIVLRAEPRDGASREHFSEVRWVIERPSWKTWGVRVVDPSGNRITTWYREDDLKPPDATYPLLTRERLDAAGVQTLQSRLEKADAMRPRPADALAPRNTLIP